MLVELGKLTACTYRDARGRSRVLRWALRSAPSLVYEKAKGRPLLVVYAPRVVRDATDDEVRAYAITHWGDEGRGLVSDGEIATAPFRELGAGVSVTYTTRKGGRAELVDWEHAWGEGGAKGWKAPRIRAHVCQNARCSRNGTIRLDGGTYRVTERGIVG